MFIKIDTMDRHQLNRGDRAFFITFFYKKAYCSTQIGNELAIKKRLPLFSLSLLFFFLKNL